MTSVRFAGAALCLLLLTAGCACTGGQSGTETPVPVAGHDAPPDGPDADVWTTLSAPCPCALAERSALLHVRLLALDACRVRARIEAVLAVAPGLTLEFEAGDELEVARRHAPGCGQGLGLMAGDEALLAYAPTPAPSATAQDAGASSPEALVATWGNPHVFGSNAETQVALPAAERDRLIDHSACSGWFTEHAPPGSEAEPGDAGDGTGGDACAAAHNAP